MGDINLLNKTEMWNINKILHFTSLLHTDNYVPSVSKQKGYLTQYQSLVYFWVYTGINSCS